jgi:hypothetical protein
MMSDTEPRDEFAAALRDWFVDEMQRPLADGDDVEREPAIPANLVPSDPARERRAPARRTWLFFANVAAGLLVVIVGLAWLGPWTDEPDESPAATVPAPEDDPAVVVADVCERLRAEAVTLPIGASADEVERAATDLRLRLEQASAWLDAVASPTAGLDEARRLADEAIAATERLVDVADAERASVDTAVTNVDLIVVAWGRELADVAGDVCFDLPTLREVF